MTTLYVGSLLSPHIRTVEASRFSENSYWTRNSTTGDERRHQRITEYDAAFETRDEAVVWVRGRITQAVQRAAFRMEYEQQRLQAFEAEVVS